MSKVHLVTPHFAPEITAAAHRMEALANTLSREHQVIVYALTERGVTPAEKEVMLSDNLTVRYIALPEYPKALFFLRAFVEAWYSVRLAFAATRRRSDWLIATSPFMFLIPAIAFFGRGRRKIMDVRDLVWCYMPDRNIFQRAIRSLLQRVIVRSLRKFDHITVTNSSEEQWMIRTAAVPRARLSIVSNGLSQDRFRRLSNIAYYPPEHPLVITYIGNIGNGQDLGPVIDVVRHLPDVKLNLIGDGIELERYRKYIRQENIRNVQFFGKMKWNRLLPFYQTSSILLARLGKNYQSALPSKLFEYLATGLPVLFYGNGEAARFLKDFENVFIVRQEDPEELRRAIRQLQTLTPPRSFANILRVESNFIREHLNLRYLDLLKDPAERVTVLEPIGMDAQSRADWSLREA
ncbi:MAG: glycosyltransferase family 4 protein [Bacteroidia bacterium]